MNQQALIIASGKKSPLNASPDFKIADVTGRAIQVGSILKHEEDGERGAVVRIVRAGVPDILGSCIGDLVVKVSPSTTRITNNYGKWRHIDHDDQTYEERFMSWLLTPFEPDPFDTRNSADEQHAMSGIMALLPSNIVNWNYGPTPDNLKNVLNLLAEHLQSLTKTKP